MLRLVGLLLLVCQVYLMTPERRECLSNRDCCDKECCLRRQNPMLSRRHVPREDRLLLIDTENGTCTFQSRIGQDCNPSYTCGCESGLKCNFTSTLSLSLKRKEVPGIYKCIDV